MSGIRKLIGCAMVLATCLLPAHATSVRPLYLDEVIDTAAVAFEGTCVENRTEVDPATGFVVTYTTFQVSDVLKGQVGAMHTIKQIGGTLPGSNRIERRIDGIPTFAVGQDYVLFLHGVSSIGFSSPVGLSQGRFGIRVEHGKRVAGNGRDFRELASRMRGQLPARAASRLQSMEAPATEMDVEEFKQAVRNHVGAPQ